MVKQHGTCMKALRAALPLTLPILAGFWFLGLSYGIYMNKMGFPFQYPMMMSLTIFAGSAEFVTADLLRGLFNPLQTFLMVFLINARHLFYGLSLLNKYEDVGRKKAYLIFGLCDESFSINYGADIPPGVDKGWFYFFVTLLNHLYWVIGATMGGLLGNLVAFNTRGIEFVMTALFVVIFVEQWLKEKSHTSALVGLASSVLCLLAFGAQRFIIPTMGLILLVIMLIKPTVNGKEGVA